MRHLAGEAGIRQFLDIGTGIPTADNTHQVAQGVAPDSRIVYVDGDLHHPEQILEQAARTLDLGEPVAITMLAVLEFVPEPADTKAIVRRWGRPQAVITDRTRPWRHRCR